MAANTSPIFVDTPRVGAATIATANAARDGTGAVPTIFTAGADGSVITRVRYKAQGTTTAGMIRLFIHDGAAFFLWHELPVGAVAAPSGTIESAEGEITFDPPLVLPSTHSLRASTHNAETFNVIAEGGDL